MAVLKEGFVTMVVLVMLLCLSYPVEGGIIHHHSHVEDQANDSNNDDIDDNNIDSDHFDSKFFESMVDTDHELTAVESLQASLEFPPEIGWQSEIVFVEGEPLNSQVLPVNLEGFQGTIENHEEKKKNDTKKSIVLVLTPSWKNPGKVKPSWKNPGKIHRRQKRFITPYKLRLIAVPLSIFNFLGFLPMRVPGLPYHTDLPSPDYTYYNTINDLNHYPRARRFKYF